MNDPHSASSDVLWACVEEGFHVGSRSGDFLGYVDRQPDGAYAAFDARSRALGSFATLDGATAAVSSSRAVVSPDDGTDEQLRGVVQL
ncbi:MULTISPECIES: hypothetical protein [unclassified Microbacterium]|uniref:hypothetical protein n=1 Tax=unclassified Microbacterium TaxID=2609290 RepID=UPI000D512C34|nr:hypothetical protein [Microbacterium sp. TPD7012]PVE95603.1 hypothetical protein DC434_08620 [Microbacterium sp. TPD7012]